MKPNLNTQYAIGFDLPMITEKCKYRYIYTFIININYNETAGIYGALNIWLSFLYICYLFWSLKQLMWVL